MDTEKQLYSAISVLDHFKYPLILMFYIASKKLLQQMTLHFKLFWWRMLKGRNYWRKNLIFLQLKTKEEMLQKDWMKYVFSPKHTLLIGVYETILVPLIL